MESHGRNISSTTSVIKNLIRSDHLVRMQQDLEKLVQYCPEHERDKFLDENRGFLKLYRDFVSIRDKPIEWDEVESFPRGALLDYNNYLVPNRSVIKNLLEKLVVVKLNGGLGTRMRCDGPKSLIAVRSDLTFLDLSVQQIENLNAEYSTNVPLVLMNSFNTIEETEKEIRKYKDLRIKIYSFEQSKYPRVVADTRSVLPTRYNDPDRTAWYPPGHGNFYEAFAKSGLIETFKKLGKEYCFVSNIDNLGATVDLRILDLLSSSKLNPSPEFIMEVTNKTAADIKGGTLIHYKGKLKLLEYAEVPRQHIEEFKCSGKFNNFNTNNLWMNLDAVKKVVENEDFALDVIPNNKIIHRKGKKIPVIQLETAAGGAITFFQPTVGILVPRSRFLPVKSTSDLFLLRSNIYINDNGKLIMNPLRPYSDVPLISLADEHFGDFRDLEKRFEQIPDCLHLHHLTVCGNVYFGKDVILKGNVTVVAHNGERIDIPRGSVLQYKIVTGSLRIVDF